jgi:hypothetical protein
VLQFCRILGCHDESEVAVGRQGFQVAQIQVFQTLCKEHLCHDAVRVGDAHFD